MGISLTKKKDFFLHFSSNKMCSKVVFTVLTLASIQFSIVRTHFKEYIIYAQSSVYQKELNSREKGSLSIKKRLDSQSFEKGR